MASVSFADLLVDKLLSFSSKMTETSFKPGSALCLMSDNPNMYFQHAGELLDQFLINGILSSEYDLSKPVQRTKIESPFFKNLSFNNLEQSKLGFSPHLFNVVQDSLRFVLGQPEVLHFPSNLLSRVLCDSVLNNSVTMKDDLCSDLQSCVQPANDTKLNISISVKSSPKGEQLEVKDNKPNSVDEFKLNVELVNRKTKEINKRSKKRRRRQKKNKNSAKSTSTPMNEINSSLASSPASSHASGKSRDESKFILSVEHNIQVSSNLVSSFVISVGNASSEDSDWDSCSEADQPEHSDFEFTGLFLTNLSTPSPCMQSSSVPVAECSMTAIFQDEDDEIASMQAVLIEVNRSWNESTKGIDKKPKSPSKVSFASDDKLAEVFPVEMYDRKGEWETYALERLRFKRRIEELEKLISPCLSANHRLEVYKKLVKSNL